METILADEDIFTKEYWSGDSRDGAIINGDGCHFFKMRKGLILEAYEVYERDDGEEVATALPEMENVHWFKDLGYTDMEALDPVKEYDFDRIRKISVDGVEP